MSTDERAAAERCPMTKQREAEIRRMLNENFASNSEEYRAAIRELTQQLATVTERAEKAEAMVAKFARHTPEPDRVLDPEAWKAWGQANWPKS